MTFVIVVSSGDASAASVIVVVAGDAVAGCAAVVGCQMQTVSLSAAFDTQYETKAWVY